MDKAHSLLTRLNRDELDLAVEAAGDGRWHWDMAYSTPILKGPLYDAFELGDLSKEIETAVWSALFHPDDLAPTQAAVIHYLRNPTGTFIVRFRLRDKQGAWRWLVSRGKSIEVDAQGRVLRMIGIHYDETPLREAELHAREESAKFAGIFQTLPDAAGSTRIADGIYLEVNPAFEKILGFQRHEVIGRSSLELNIWASARERDRLVGEFRKHGRVDRLEMTARTKCGRLIPGQMSASTARIGGEECFVFVFRDLTQEKQTQDALRFSQSALDAAGRMGRLGAWVIYFDGVQPDYWSPMCREIVGISADESVPQDFAQRFVLSEHRQKVRDAERLAREQMQGWDIEVEIRRPAGDTLWVRVVGEPVGADGKLDYIRGLMQDVTEQHLYQDKLQYLAHYDALTGLPNRILLADRMRQAMARADRTGEILGVVYMDLDGFKPVNDRLGHGAGDELLKILAARLPKAMRGEDSVARLGGDEFVLLLTALKNIQDCELAIQRAMLAIGEPYLLGNASATVTASMGVTLYPLDRSDADTLLRHADQAMFVAKQGGRNRVHFFDPDEEAVNRSRNERLSELQHALLEGQFVLFLQPRVNMRTGHILGAEALARWQHPLKGLLSPAYFLPDIESSELNIAFGQWVIGSALAQLQRWCVQGLDLALSINITACHLQTPHFSRHLAQEMAKYPQVPAGRLEIEVTESGSLSDLGAAVAVIKELHLLGVQVSLDDFGTGYSSLTYLRRLPVDTLKIDQTFVRDMLVSKDDRAIVMGVISLALSFGLSVVAEGVETTEQGELLLEMGCDMAQGYRFARPMPEPELADWMQAWQLAAAPPFSLSRW